MEVSNQLCQITRKKFVHVGLRKGVIHIQASFNNTIITVTDVRGQVILWCSAGACGFRSALSHVTSHGSFVETRPSSSVDDGTFFIHENPTFRSDSSLATHGEDTPQNQQSSVPRQDPSEQHRTPGAERSEIVEDPTPSFGVNQYWAPGAERSEIVEDPSIGAIPYMYWTPGAERSEIVEDPSPREHAFQSWTLGSSSEVEIVEDPSGHAIQYRTPPAVRPFGRLRSKRKPAYTSEAKFQ